MHNKYRPTRFVFFSFHCQTIHVYLNGGLLKWIPIAPSDSMILLIWTKQTHKIGALMSLSTDYLHGQCLLLDSYRKNLKYVMNAHLSH